MHRYLNIHLVFTSSLSFNGDLLALRYFSKLMQCREYINLVLWELVARQRT